MNIPLSLFLAGIGGFAGAVCRLTVTLLLQPFLASIPFNTLLVNISGCMIIGVVSGFIDASIALPPQARILIVTGFCGAFTTMSSFIYEIDQLLREGNNWPAFFYFFATITGSYTLFFAGRIVVRMLIRI